jgi:hypothetical protein
MKKYSVLITLLLLVVILTSCAARPSPDLNTPGEDGKVAGFWTSLWQGMVAPFTFLISLFTDNVNVYEVHNNGNWYDFGFVLGAGILVGGGSSTSRRRRY